MASSNRWGVVAFVGRFLQRQQPSGTPIFDLCNSWNEAVDRAIERSKSPLGRCLVTGEAVIFRVGAIFPNVTNDVMQILDRAGEMIVLDTDGLTETATVIVLEANRITRQPEPR